MAEAFELTQKYIQAEPEIGVHYVRLAKLYSNENRTDEAIATYEKAMEFAPGNRQIFLNMADLYLRNDNMVEAEKAFKNAIPFTTSSYDRENIERKLINLYRYQGNLDEMLQKAEDEGTITSGMQRERARSYLNKGELQQSVEAFKKAIDMTTDSYARDRISNELLEVYVQLDDTDSALEIFEKNVSSGSTYRSMNTSSARIYMTTGADRARDTLINAYNNQSKLEQLKTLYEGKRKENPDNSAILGTLAKIYWSGENYKEAAEVYQTLGKLQPGNVFNFYSAGAALKKTGQQGVANEMFNQGENAIASSSDKNDMWFLGSLASICFENNMYDSAIKHAESALANSSNYGSSYVQDILKEILAKSYREDKRYDNAVKIYRELANTAYYTRTQDRAKIAIQEIAKAGNFYEKWIPEQLKKVEANPNNTDARFILAQSYESTAQNKEAAEQYEKLSELQPHNPDWHKKLGGLYGKLLIERRETGEVIEGTALMLSGNGSYVEINDSESISNILDQVTVSAWIKCTDFPDAYAPIISKTGERDPEFKNRSYFLNLKADGSIRFAASPKGESDVNLYSPTSVIELNTWTHIAGVIDAKNDIIKLFIDGIEVSNKNFKGVKSIYNSKLPLRIGWTQEEIPTHASVNGLIDEVRVWNIARTEDEIRSDMNIQLNGDEPGLVGYWKFDEEENGQITDATPNKNDGKLIGNAKIEPYTRLIFESSRSGFLAKSTSSYKKVVELDPTSYESYSLLAQSYSKAKQVSDAEAVYRQALDAPLSQSQQSQHNSAIKAISELYAEKGQEDKRIAILEEIKPKMHGSAVLHDLLGSLYKTKGDTEKAELAYTKWLKIRQKEINSRQSAYYYHDFADVLLEKELFPETALIFAKRALQSYTGTSYTYPTTLAEAYVANQLFDDALKYFNQALESTSSASSTERIWKRVTDASKMAKDKELYTQMIHALIDTIPPESASARANAYRMIAQFYSQKGMPKTAENYVLKGGFIPETRWITLGPFKNIDSIGVENAYIPEETTQIDTTAKYYGRDELISWKKSKYRSLDGHYIFVSDNNDDWSAAYVWAIVISPDERDIIMRFDSDDQGTVWLNGKQVFNHLRTSGERIDRYTIPVTLKQGENTILVKICNSSQGWGFYMRLTDAEGNPIEDLQYKTADELLNAPPPDPTFNVYSILGMAEYYSKNNMPDKALEQMRLAGIIHENKWFVLGPFDNTAGIGYNTAYIPEDVAQIDTVTKYDGVDGKIGWQKYTDDAFDGFIDFGRYVNWRVSYAWTTVTSPDEREVQLRFGKDDQGKLWLNGNEVFADEKEGWPVVDRNIIPVKLKAGKNTILVKVCNEEISFGFFLRITDADGKPFEDLKINDAQDN